MSSQKRDSGSENLHKINELIEKYDSMKKHEKMDLSSDQDLSIAIMNLISIEEHLIFSGAKTGKTHFYDLIIEIREMRKNLLKTIIKEYEGEVWCISKHLLAASMRLMEVGTKAQNMENPKEAYAYFEKAYDLYSLFWGLQMNVITSENIGEFANHAEIEDETPKSTSAKEMKTESKSAITHVKMADEPVRRGGFMGKLGDLVRKAVDCCIE